jgi:hypothetical protein
MKIIRIISLAALVAALTTSASAFPYTNPHYGMPDREFRGNAPAGHTIGVFAHGRGLGFLGFERPDNRLRMNWAGQTTFNGWR